MWVVSTSNESYYAWNFAEDYGAADVSYLNVLYGSPSSLNLEFLSFQYVFGCPHNETVYREVVGAGAFAAGTAYARFVEVCK